MTLNAFKKRLSANRFLKSYCGLTLILLMISCGAFYTKDNYIEDFRSFVKDVKDNCTTYSETDWADIDKQYDKFAVDYYEKFKPELSSDEKLSINKLKGAYAVLKVKKGANELFDQAKDLLNQAKGVLDSTIETIKK